VGLVAPRVIQYLGKAKTDTARSHGADKAEGGDGEDQDVVSW
jgi:hypothetical protein